jgi:hypothetical protein
MDNRSIFLYHQGGAMGGRRRVGQPVIGFRCQARRRPDQENPDRRELRGVGGAVRPEVVEPVRQEKPLSDETPVTVPQTDTGRRVENTKAIGRTLVKEFGKIAP